MTPARSSDDESMFRMPLVSFVAISLIVSLSSRLPWTTHAQSVPTEYADLYAFLDNKLQAADSYITSHGNGQRHNTTFSTELLAANANQGESLLAPQAWQSILFNLDGLQWMGVRAVKVAIKYPILVPGFPRSADYLDLYRRLGQELQRRNMKFLAQMTPAFTNPVFSSLPVAPYYAGLTLDRYKQEKRQMAETIIREIRPDYLTIENEPGTAQENTGLPFTVQNYVGIVQHILAGLNRSGVLVGAGAGTWDELAYFEGLARLTTLDYIDMHIYPVNYDFLIDRATNIADITKRHNKRLVLGEAWLYKSRDRELSGAPVAAAAGLFGRDVYSFWEPLDVKFIQVISKLSHYLEIEFASFFWMRYFFGYIEYNQTTRSLTPAELFRLANLGAARNMLATPPQMTRTGLMFQQLLNEK